MGSTTTFRGHFTISPPLADDEIEELNLFCENPKGDNLPGHNCDWIFENSYEDDELETTMAWNGMEKSYDMPEWACYIMNHFDFLGESNIEGRIKARGEEFDDIWTMVACPIECSITREEGWNA